MGWPEKITAEMDKDINGIWFPSFSSFPLVYGKCDYIRADLVAARELEIVRATQSAINAAMFEEYGTSTGVRVDPATILKELK